MSALIKNFVSTDANNQDFSSVWGFQASTASGDEDYEVSVGQETILSLTNSQADNGNTDGPRPFFADGRSIAIPGNLAITIGGTTPELILYGQSK